MAYYSGTATGPTDLLDKIRTALVAEGWTENDYSVDGTGYRLHVQKVAQSGGPTMYFNFRSAVDEYGSTITEDNTNSDGLGNVTGILINGSTGYDGGEDWHTQPGYPQGDDNKSYASVMSEMSVSAIPAYYIFFMGDSVHIVVEVTSGKFQMMSFGCLVKQGAYTGGQYFSASLSSRTPYKEYHDPDHQQYRYTPRYFTRPGYAGYYQSHGSVYVDADSDERWRRSDESNKEIQWQGVGGYSHSGDSYGQYMRMGLCSFFHGMSPNYYTNIAALCPVYVILLRSDAENYSLLGWPEGVRFINFTNYSAGQEVTHGTDTWKIFHANGSNEDSEYDNEYCGFAYLKEL